MSGYAYAGSRIEGLSLSADAAAAAGLAGAATAGGIAAAADDDDAWPAEIAAAATQQQQQQQQDTVGTASSSSQPSKQQQQQSSSTSPASEASGATAAAAAADAASKALAASAPPSAAAAAAAAIEEDVEKITCVVCLEHPTSIAVGPCDHHQLCAMCCLRLRLCYKDNRCPLCKTEAKQVCACLFFCFMVETASCISALQLLFSSKCKFMSVNIVC
jgi:hypothetical protein